MIMLTFDATIFDEVTGTHLVSGLNFFNATGGTGIAFCFLLFCAAAHDDILYTPIGFDSVEAHQWLQVARFFQRREERAFARLSVRRN